MTAIDSLSPPIENFQAAVESATLSQPVVTQAPALASAPVTTSSASSVAPQLAALQPPVAAQATASSSAEVFRMVGKVVEALVSVVQAFMSLVTQLLPKTGSSSGVQSSGTQNANTAGGNTTGASTSATQASTVATTPPSVMAGSMFDVTKSDAGMVAVRTRDGYMIRAEGKDQAWTITGPDGKTTRIWGDPHVNESDGNKWDFKTRATFAFGNNKATVEVVPAGNGETLSARVTIYSGDERVTIDGIDKNKPLVAAVSRDGRQHDDALADGITFDRALNSRGESWRSNLTGKIM